MTKSCSHFRKTVRVSRVESFYYSFLALNRINSFSDGVMPQVLATIILFLSLGSHFPLLPKEPSNLAGTSVKQGTEP